MYCTMYIHCIYIQALQKPLRVMSNGVQQLDEGKYHDVATVRNRLVMTVYIGVSDDCIYI